MPRAKAPTGKERFYRLTVPRVLTEKDQWKVIDMLSDSMQPEHAAKIAREISFLIGCSYAPQPTDGSVKAGLKQIEAAALHLVDLLKRDGNDSDQVMSRAEGELMKGGLTSKDAYEMALLVPRLIAESAAKQLANYKSGLLHTLPDKPRSVLACALADRWIYWTGELPSAYADEETWKVSPFVELIQWCVRKHEGGRIMGVTGARYLARKAIKGRAQKVIKGRGR